jgi:ribosome biogenesis GTPase
MQCRFKDCSHTAKSGCAVMLAIERGELDPSRLESYGKLQKEITYLAAREEENSRMYEKAKNKKIALWSKQIQKGR